MMDNETREELLQLQQQFQEMLGMQARQLEVVGGIIAEIRPIYAEIQKLRDHLGLPAEEPPA